MHPGSTVGQPPQRILTRRRTLLGTSALAAGVLGACGPFQSAAPSRPAALSGKVQVAFRTDATTKAGYDPIADEFRQRYPTVQLEFVDVGGSYDAPLLAQFVAGTPPDVMWVRLTNFASYLYKKLLLNVEPLARRDARAAQLDDIFPGILDQGRLRDGLYGLPADGGGPVIFWNVGLFERAGLPAPGTLNDTNKWTADAFLDVGKKLVQRSGGKTEVWGAHDPLFHNTIWLGWLWAWGGEFLTKDGGTIALDQPRAVEALQWQQDLIVRDGVIPTTAELAELQTREPSDRRTMFRNQRVAMISDWTTTVGFGRLREAEQQGLRWDATLLPSGRAGQFSVSFFHEFCAAAASKVPELAWQVLAFYSNQEATLRKCLVGGTQPYRRSVATSPEFLRTLPPAFAKSQLKVGERSRPYPLVVEDENLQKVLTEEIGLLRDGKRPAREAAQSIKQRVDPLLQTKL